MKKFGIDISRWQGNFNFEKAIAEGVEFVIVKGGGGDAGLYTDIKFEHNYKQAKDKKLPVGCYWFSKAVTVAEAEKEAEYFHTKILNGKQFELPVYMDVEHNDMLGLGKDKLTSIIKAFCEKMEAYGYWVGIYSTPYCFSAHMNDADLKPYAHWVAQWSTACTYPNEFGIWQFGGETNLIRSNQIAGVTCDQNYMYVDYPTLIKNAGLNGFSKKVAVAKPVLKSVDEIAKEVIQGKWGNGADRKNKLTNAGYNYAEVQAKVDAMLKPATPAKKSVAEIAKEVVRGDWGVGADRKQRLTEAGYNYAEVQAEVNKYFK